MTAALVLAPVPAQAVEAASASRGGQAPLADFPGLLGGDGTLVSLSLFSLSTSQTAVASSKVKLAVGAHQEWIDRIDFTGNEYARSFYDLLAEATDNDGTADYLIDDAYATGTYPAITAVAVGEMFSSGSYNGILVAKEAFTAQEGFAGASVRTQNYLNAAAFAFDRDYPEVFWLSSSVGLLTSVTMDGSGGGTIYRGYLVADRSGAYQTRIAGYASQAAIKQGIARCKNQVAAIAATGDASSAARTVRTFNDWLTAHNQYNTTSAARLMAQASSYTDPWRPFSALEGRMGAAGPVCEGYARAFKMLCDSVGIPCVLVDGYARATPNSAGEAHMWNAVAIGDAWYAVDVTWNDPMGGTGAVSGAEGNQWTLVGSSTPAPGAAGWTFAQSHPAANTPAEGYAFTNGPALASTAFAGNSADAAVAGTGKASVSYQLPAAAVPTTSPAIDLTQGVITVGAATYTGAAVQPSLSVKVAGKTLRLGTDYTATFANNVKPGTATVTVRGKGVYTGTFIKHFSIAPANLAKATVKLSSVSYGYNGKARKPAVTVTVGGAKLASTAYTVSYAAGRKAVGRYAVTVKAKGSGATGSKTVRFTIVPAATKISSLKATSRGFRLRWKKGNAQVTGYQVQYATKKSFKGAKTLKVSKRATTTATVTKLKAKTKYYVRVRAYAKKSGTWYYSAWSSVKTVTTKK